MSFSQGADEDPSVERGFKTFRKNRQETRLSADSAKRQGQITNLALSLLGGSEAAMAFLNTRNEALNARPLDLAIVSLDGFAAVESVLRQLVAKQNLNTGET